MNDEETREEMGEIPLSQRKGKYKSLEVKKDCGVFQQGKKGAARGESAAQREDWELSKDQMTTGIVMVQCCDSLF